jgi:hypothetical protein
MNKILTLVTVLCLGISSGILAQATPNAGFETWTHNSFPSYDTPDSWSVTNSQTSITGVYACLKSTTVHSGSFALQLVTKNIGAPLNQLIPGVATTGTLPTSSTGSITGGIAYTLRPDSITGWYEYSPQGGENGMVSLFLFGSGGMSDTVGVASFVTPTTGVTSYKRFSAPLVYRSANAVANSIWLLASSKNDAATAGVGSTIWVDDLSIVINPTSGIMEHSLPEISLYPNPASDLLFIHNPSNARVLFSLYDVTGRKISEEKLNGVNNNLSLSDVPEGMYIYSLSDEHNAVVKTGKLVVRK